MRVLHYVPVFSQLSETFIYHSILCLEELGVENAVLTDRRVFERERPFARVYHTQPADSPFKRLKRYLQFYQYDAGWLRDLSAAIKAFKPDLLQAHFGPNGYRLLPLARRYGLPLVTAFHGYDIFSLGKRPTWALRYRRLRRAGTAFTFVSRYMREAAVRQGFPQERSSLIHVGVRESDFPFCPPSRKECAGPVRLLSIGSLVEKKGHADLIEALALVRRGGVDARLSIIGEGPERPKLEALRSSLGLEGCVELPGGLQRERVREELGRAQLFALASKTARNGNKEGIPTVLMEAQLAGLPVCSTRHSGIPEVIPEAGQRWLAPEANAPALAACLRDLIANSNQWDEAAEKGRRHVLENFNLKTETGKLISLYESLGKVGEIHGR